MLLHLMFGQNRHSQIFNIGVTITCYICSYLRQWYCILKLGVLNCINTSFNAMSDPMHGDCSDNPTLAFASFGSSLYLCYHSHTVH